MRLPPGWLDPSAYFVGLIRDMKAASANGAVDILRKGHYTTTSGLSGTYMEFSFAMRGDLESRVQIAHFITDGKMAFIVFVTVSTDGTPDKAFDDGIAIFRTASFTEVEDLTLKPSAEQSLVGKWIGSMGHELILSLELRSDLSFKTRVTLNGELRSVRTGVWSLIGTFLRRDYLYGEPPLPENLKVETDEVISMDDQELVLVSQRSGARCILRKEENSPRVTSA